MRTTERIRELATAVLDRSARRVDTVELCNLVLAAPGREGPMTDGELAALGALAIAEETAMTRADAARAALGQSPAYGDDSWSDATVRLGAELRDRGVIL